MQENQTHTKGIRIARNAMMLYVRMLVLLFVGLFTSRVVLSALGVENFGIYTAVGGIVVLFNVLTHAVSSAISRFMSYELGKGDMARLTRVFSVSRILLLLLCVLLIVLTETLGVWFLENKMNIPPGRMEAAHWVLQGSLGVMIVNLLAIPYNSLIISREKMGVFALVSIVEGGLKLTVAFLLYLSSWDKLIVYALLMLGVALMIRGLYAVYCKRNFAESRAPWFKSPVPGEPLIDKSLLKEMFAFAGWNSMSSSVFLFNTQGINILQNLFFGVLVNAGRGIATQVEGIFKQFSSNIMLAFNPQIVKSYASGDKAYCYLMVQRATKFTYLVQLLLAIPIWIETEYLLQLWLGQVPEYAVTFVRLAILCTLVDMTSNALFQLILATGKLKTYSLTTTFLSLLVFPLSWMSYKIGAAPEFSYIIFVVVYSIVFIVKGFMARRLAAFPLRKYVKLLFQLTAIAFFAYFCAGALSQFSGLHPFLRLCLVTLVSTLIILLMSYFLVLTVGEKQYIKNKLARR